MLDIFSTLIAPPLVAVDVGTATGCLRFSEFMWRTLAKGATITIQGATP